MFSEAGHLIKRRTNLITRGDSILKENNDSDFSFARRATSGIVSS